MKGARPGRNREGPAEGWQGPPEIESLSDSEDHHQDVENFKQRVAGGQI